MAKAMSKPELELENNDLLKNQDLRFLSKHLFVTFPVIRVIF